MYFEKFENKTSKKPVIRYIRTYAYKCTHIKGNAFYGMISVRTYVRTFIKTTYVNCYTNEYTYMARFVAKGDIIRSSNSATLMSHNFVCD